MLCVQPVEQAGGKGLFLYDEVPQRHSLLQERRSEIGIACRASSPGWPAVLEYRERHKAAMELVQLY